VFTYAASTASGLQSVNLTCNRVDTTSPVLTLLGSATVNLAIGDTYTDAGATATDSLQGDLTSAITTANLPVDTAVAGTTTVTYSVSDGTQSASLSRSVVIAPPWSAVGVLYGTETYSATASVYNPLSLSVSLLSHGYGTTFAAYMGPNNSNVSDPAMLWGNRGNQKHVGVWYDAPSHLESSSGYATPVHLTYRHMEFVWQSDSRRLRERVDGVDIRARVQHVCRDNALEEHVGVIHGLHRNDPRGFGHRLQVLPRSLPEVGDGI
jgi:hypothetical protein